MGRAEPDGYTAGGERDGRGGHGGPGDTRMAYHIGQVPLVAHGLRLRPGGDEKGATAEEQATVRNVIRNVNSRSRS